MSATHKVVFDTQIFLRAVINPNSACGRAIVNQQADFQLFSAVQIEFEILDVLSRPKIRAKFPQITDERVEPV